ncbi:heme-copper oxidase subunit III [Halocatena pleomorpha]|uniref:Heme-copper oxidase subunit III n=1 Tax=Halocatena pleomorpha TaxID=1785090 RepID=A0A3P3RFG1_9EURY|nr:heme-copper oxidase subunit III [Halocatena pleomorpha]RRJ31500.1 heme-copper oxidase subunit III [Halocatena pleomorpha]
MTDERTTQGGDGRPRSEETPGVYDWPTTIEETSLWPVMSAVGVGLLYVGVATIIIGYGLGYGVNSFVPQWPGFVLFFVGLGLFVSGLLGWLYHAFVYRYWEYGTDIHAQLTLRSTTLLFLITEVATFSAGFTYYFYIRAHPWPRGVIPELLSPVVFVNTVLLVTSSVTVHFAHRALHENDRTRFLRLLGVTVALGAVFLIGQLYEYYEFVVREGYTLSSGLFASAFYGLTGLHGLHVTLGVVLLSIVFVRGWLLEQYSATRMTSISTVSMYWHFVDGVWLFLVTAVYIGASISAP